MANDDQGQPQIVTGANGAFEFNGVVPGTYMLTVLCAGFERNFEVMDVKAGQRLEGANILLRLTADLEDPGRGIGAPRPQQR